MIPRLASLLEALLTPTGVHLPQGWHSGAQGWAQSAQWQQSLVPPTVVPLTCSPTQPFLGQWQGRGGVGGCPSLRALGIDGTQSSVS